MWCKNICKCLCVVKGQTYRFCLCHILSQFYVLSLLATLSHPHMTRDEKYSLHSLRSLCSLRSLHSLRSLCSLRSQRHRELETRYSSMYLQACGFSPKHCISLSPTLSWNIPLLSQWVRIKYSIYDISTFVICNSLLHLLNYYLSGD